MNTGSNIYVSPRVYTRRVCILGAVYAYQISRNLVSIHGRVFMYKTTEYGYSVDNLVPVLILGKIFNEY